MDDEMDVNGFDMRVDVSNERKTPLFIIVLKEKKENIKSLFSDKAGSEAGHTLSLTLTFSFTLIHSHSVCKLLTHRHVHCTYG